jgi:phosphoketolase
MPMPSAARAIKRNVKLGEKPATKLHTEYQRMESISGVLRPMRSASQPEAGRTHESFRLPWPGLCAAEDDNPDLIVTCIIGDGEAETGALERLDPRGQKCVSVVERLVDVAAVQA